MTYHHITASSRRKTIVFLLSIVLISTSVVLCSARTAQEPTTDTCSIVLQGGLATMFIDVDNHKTSPVEISYEVQVQSLLSSRQDNYTSSFTVQPGDHQRIPIHLGWYLLGASSIQVDAPGCIGQTVGLGRIFFGLVFMQPTF